MNDTLFFGPEEYKRGESYTLRSEIETNEGRYYELEDWLNRGGHAAVYQCRDRSTGGEYAIKVLMRTNRKSRIRFAREVKLLNELEGDHITRYHGTGELTATQNQNDKLCKFPFIVMELARSNLQDVIRSESETLHYEYYAGQFRGLAKALAMLHRYAVHRDIKPSNILVGGERWLLSDYGLCTFEDEEGDDLTYDERKVGPTYWLSPEAQNRVIGSHDHIRKYSDVFQLAAVFWYVATGRHPCGIVTQGDWTGPEKLFPLLQKSLFHDYTKRPQNGSEFSAELEEALLN